MKNIYLIGFRGTGFRNLKFTTEPGLIRAGHVGFFFEGQPEKIYGFHPTTGAVETLGGDNAVIEWLKEHNSLPGTVQDDLEIFLRAYTLARLGERTDVWQIAIPVEDEIFEQIRTTVVQWYTDKKEFTYAFPPLEGLPSDTVDNCATFPRRLGLPLPEPTGQLFRYMEVLENAGEKWKPE